MSARPLLVSLAAVVVSAAIAAVLLDRPSSPEAPPQAASPSSPSTPACDDAPAVPPLPPRSPPPATITATRVASDDGAAAKAIDAATLEMTPVDGTIVVSDADEVDHPSESGTITLFVWMLRPLDHGLLRFREDVRRPPTRLGPIPVTAGRFHLELPAPPQSFHLELQLTLGARPAALDDGLTTGGLTGVARSGTLALHAHWIAGIPLHVVDQESHGELDEVEIVRRKGFDVHRLDGTVDRASRLESFHPGRQASTEVLVAHGVSPLHVFPHCIDGHLQISDEWFVRAAGHAWTRINLNFEASVARTVELRPGATLIVDVKGELPRRKSPSTGAPLVPVFRLSETLRNEIGNPISPREKPVEEEPARIGETRVESLEPGDVVASIEIDREHDAPLVVAHAEATLAAGETKRVTLVLVPAAAQEAVPLAGTLFVPDGWQIPKGRLSIRPIDLVDGTAADERELPLAQMEPVPGQRGLLHWNAGAVVPATYEFDVDGAGFARTIGIEPPGDDHVELTLAAPAKLLVHLVDDATGTPLVFPSVCWRCSQESTRRGVGLIELELERDRSTYSGLVPQGDGCVSWSGDLEWSFDRSTIGATIQSSEHEVTVAMHRAIGIVLELADGLAKVPWPDELHCEIDATEGSGHLASMEWRDGVLRLEVTEAGAYRVTIPAIPGYARVEPFEINLPEGRLGRRVVHLARR